MSKYIKNFKKTKFCVKCCKYFSEWNYKDLYGKLNAFIISQTNNISNKSNKIQTRLILKNRKSRFFGQFI